MKKFSKITGEKISEKPKSDVIRINEEDIFRSKIMNLMDQLLSIRTYGPIDRYQRAGNIKIAGKEMFLEALMGLLNTKSLKDQIKVLENIKSDIKDWSAIDSKIEHVNSEISKISENSNLLSHKKKLYDLYNNYNGDEETILLAVENISQKIKNLDTIKLRIMATEQIINEGKYPKDIFSKIHEKLNIRYSQLIDLK